MGNKQTQLRKKAVPSQRSAAENSGSGAQKKYGKKETPFEQQKTVQGNFKYINFDKSDKKYWAMMDIIENSNNPYLNFFKSKWGTVQITLDDSQDKNPGSASKIVKQKGGGWEHVDINDIREMPEIEELGALITIRKWYFEKYSIGKILSMIAHEVGVHIVPYMKEIGLKMSPEAQEAMGIDFNSPPDTSKQSGDRGIIDHQRVATIGSDDFFLYQQVIIDMINAIIETNKHKLTSEEINMHGRDLADAYLMDISTFLGSGRRVVVPFFAQSIANKYNKYSLSLGIRGLPGRMSRGMKKKKSRDVVSDYTTLYKNVLPIAIRQHPRVSGTIAMLLVLTLIYFIMRIFR